MASAEVEMCMFLSDFVANGGKIDGLEAVGWGDFNEVRYMANKSGSPAFFKNLATLKPGQLPSYILALAKQCPWATAEIGRYDDFVVTLEAPAKGVYTFKTQGWQKAEKRKELVPLSAFMKQKMVERYGDFGLVNSDGTSHWKTDGHRYVWETPLKAWPSGVYHLDGQGVGDDARKAVTLDKARKALVETRVAAFREVHVKANDLVAAIKKATLTEGNSKAALVWIVNTGAELVAVTDDSVTPIKTNGGNWAEKPYAASFSFQQLSDALRGFGKSKILLAAYEYDGGCAIGENGCGEVIEAKNEAGTMLVWLTGFVKSRSEKHDAMKKAEKALQGEKSL